MSTPLSASIAARSRDLCAALAFLVLGLASSSAAAQDIVEPPEPVTPVLEELETPAPERPRVVQPPKDNQRLVLSYYDAKGEPVYIPCGSVAPILSEAYETHFSVDEPASYRFSIENRDHLGCWEELEIEGVNLPRGATLEVWPERGYAELVWTPRFKDLGDHRMQVRVRAKGYKDSRVSTRVTVTDEWETFFMPGVNYALHLPNGDRALDPFHGVSVEYLIAGWIHRNDNHGPSHGRIYANVALLSSTDSANPALLKYHLGLNLSLERNPKRRVMIPLFGVETGGFYYEDLGSGYQITPLAGLHVYGARNAFINIIGGYMFPLTHLEEMRGWHVKGGLNVSFW